MPILPPVSPPALTRGGEVATAAIRTARLKIVIVMWILNLEGCEMEEGLCLEVKLPVTKNAEQEDEGQINFIVRE